jgi:hypothetical protein
MDKPSAPPTGIVIAFPGPASRRTASQTASRDTAGEIVLFTGIRYERLIVAMETPRPFVSGEPGQRRRP